MLWEAVAKALLKDPRVCLASLTWQRRRRRVLSPLPWRFSFLPNLQTVQRPGDQLKSQESLSAVQFLLLFFSKSYLVAWNDFWELICLSAVTVSDLSEAGKGEKPLQ